MKLLIPAFVIILLTALVSQIFAQTVPVNGLTDKVTVRRDGRAIPYIEAANENDLYFTQGYVTASDRLWQMDLMRRVARGETAEIFGKAGLEEDKRWRRLGFAGIADESIQYLSPELKAALENYAKGVNAYIATLDEKTLPIEFKILQYKPQPWKSSDTLVIGKILADALSSTWRLDLLKASLQSLPKDKFDDLANTQTEYDVIMFGKDVPKAKKAAAGDAKRFDIPDSLLASVDAYEIARKSSLSRVGLYAEELAASNNWVISGKRTADGKPLIANDPHLLATAPGIWYMTHLETPTMRVAGVTFPGVPGIVLGHNDQIAWGATNVGPDVQDLFIETFDDTGRYKTESGWEPPKIRKEEIRVRTNILKPDTEIVSIDVTETRNGTVILEEGGKKYSLKWTARDPKNNDFGAFFALNRAKNWDDFNNALSSYRGASQNFVFADTKGNIGWHIAGAIPTRKSGDGSLPYDGATNDGEWTGLIPYAELPNLYNPSSGFIVTANQRIVGTDYKYQQLVREIAPPWRARRLYDLLNAETKATMDFVSKAQHDAHNIPLSNLAKEITKANGASPETLELIRSWDGRMMPDSKAALIVNEIRGCLATKIADENKPAPANAIRERILDWAVRERSAKWLPKQFADYPAFLKACDAESTSSLTGKYGADTAKWVWGSVSASRFPHPLAAAPLIGGQFAAPVIGLDGSGQTPNVASYVSMRFIASPGNWDATRHVIPLGQSGDPRSPHFKDQFDTWRTGTPAVFPFSKDAVAKAATASVILTPK
jgi:penicillin amidase